MDTPRVDTPLNATSPVADVQQDRSPRSAAHLQLTELLLTQFPRNPSDVRFALKMGNSMVSGATVGHVHLTDENGEHQLMAKLQCGIGDRERAGAQCIQNWLRVPAEYPHGQGPDHYLYTKVKGYTVHDLVRGISDDPNFLAGGPSAAEEFREQGLQAYLRAVQEHLTMWRATIGQGTPGGYARKLDQIEKLIGDIHIGGHSVGFLRERSFVVNGVRVPPLREIIAALHEIVRGETTTVMSHGDEGLANVVVEGKTGDLFYIDHGSAGCRIVGEPIAKLLCWFLATFVRVDDTRDYSRRIGREEIVFNYSIGIPPEVRVKILEARRLIEADLGDTLNQRTLFACITMYLIRELQWFRARGNNDDFLPALLGMALEAAGGMFGNTDQLPGFSSA